MTIRTLQEDLKAIGMSADVAGGAERLDAISRLFGTQIMEAIEESTSVVKKVVTDEAPLEEDEYEGAVLTEELLERLESLDFDAADEELIEELIERLLDKKVPEELEERLRDLLELKKIRIVGGKIKRVNVLRGSKAMRMRRKKRLTYKRKKAHMKVVNKKRERKAGAKMKAAKTARKHLSFDKKIKNIVGKVAKKLGGTVKAVKAKAGLNSKSTKSESVLVSELKAMLLEDVNNKPSIRDEVMVRMGDIALYLEQLFGEDENFIAFLGEQYAVLADEYCNGTLSEARVNDEAFKTQITPFVNIIGKCVEELEKNA